MQPIQFVQVEHPDLNEAMHAFTHAVHEQFAAEEWEFVNFHVLQGAMQQPGGVISMNGQPQMQVIFIIIGGFQRSVSPADAAMEGMAQAMGGHENMLRTFNDLQQRTCQHEWIDGQCIRCGMPQLDYLK